MGRAPGASGPTVTIGLSARTVRHSDSLGHGNASAGGSSSDASASSAMVDTSTHTAPSRSARTVSARPSRATSETSW